jgi:four helix bundle protein
MSKTMLVFAMPGIQRVEDIKAWQKARELVREVYKACVSMRLGRDFGLRDEICRAAVSTMSKNAKGFSRKTDRDFAHVLDMAQGSCGEVQSLLDVAMDTEHLPQSDFELLSALANAVASLIGSFTSYLRNGRQGEVNRACI